MPRKFDESKRTRFHIVDDMKVCKTCRMRKALSEFKGKVGRTVVAHCNDCYPDYVKYQNIKRKFGLSKEQYDTLIAEGCAICGSVYRLAIDHDHACCPSEKSCGVCIRGVLCMRHNVALGQVADSVEELELMIGYLKN